MQALIAFGFVILGAVLVSGDCPLGLEEQLVCKGSQQKTCGQHTVSKRTKGCKKEVACRCPRSSPYKWNDQCYTCYQCPKKSHDAPSNNRTGHNFIIGGRVNANGQMYGQHISALKLPQHWYHSIVLFEFQSQTCADVARNAQIANKNNFISINYVVPMKLVDLLTAGKTINANIGLSTGPYFRFLTKCEVKIVKVLDLRRYKADLSSYPGFQKYFLFGDDKDAFISHLPTKCRDFQQLVWLKSPPAGFTKDELKKGAVIEIPSLDGEPDVSQDGVILDPLSKKSYDINPAGRRGKMSTIEVERVHVMDTYVINIGC